MAAVAALFVRIVTAVFYAAWRIARVLWVCRVPAISALGGGAMMILVPQAVDLFADTGLPGWRWAWFFFSLFIWAWLVHAMARRALQFDEWVPEAHRPGGLSASSDVGVGDFDASVLHSLALLLQLFGLKQDAGHQCFDLGTVANRM